MPINSGVPSVWPCGCISYGSYRVHVALHSSRGDKKYADNHIARETAVSAPRKIQAATVQRTKRLLLVEETRIGTVELSRVGLDLKRLLAFYPPGEKEETAHLGRRTVLGRLLSWGSIRWIEGTTVWLEQWFSNFTMHQNHLEGLFKHSSLSPTPRISALVGWCGQRICICDKFPGAADAAYLVTKLR